MHAQRWMEKKSEIGNGSVGKSVEAGTSNDATSVTEVPKIYTKR